MFDLDWSQILLMVKTQKYLIIIIIGYRYFINQIFQN